MCGQPEAEDAGSGSSSSCAGLPLTLPPLFLQQPPSLTTDCWPWYPVGSASYLCLFIGFASFLTLCSSPEFHLLWPLIYSNLRWFMTGPRLWGTSNYSWGGGEVSLPFPFGLAGCWFSSCVSFVSQAHNSEIYWFGPGFFKLCLKPLLHEGVGGRQGPQPFTLLLLSSPALTHFTYLSSALDFTWTRF